MAMTPPLPGLSLVLYQVYTHACGRWATPNWMMGCETGAPRAYKPLKIAWKPATMTKNF